MKRLVVLLMLAALVIVPAAEAGTESTLFISNPQPYGNGATFDFEDRLGLLTFWNARLAVWDRQDNPSFQTLSDWGASFLTGPSIDPDTGYVVGTIYVPEVLSDHCNRSGPMAIFFKLRVVVKPSRTTTKLTWMAICP